MKIPKIRLLLFIVTLALPLAAASSALAQLGECADCHSDIRDVLPDKHAEVGAKDISDCLKCHQAPENPYASNVFSTSIHRPHLAGSGKLDCSFCHEIEVDKRFGLPGRPSLGLPDAETLKYLPEIAETWADSPYLGAMHAEKNLSCSACHAEKLPLLDEKPSNEDCLRCHESYAALAARTPGKDHESRNPHDSHLGPINCTVCHKAHQASINYCLDCHKLFEMNPVPGAE